MRQKIGYVRPAFAGEIYDRREVVNRSPFWPWSRRGYILFATFLALLGGVRYVELLFPSVVMYQNADGTCHHVIDERSDRRDEKPCDFLKKYGGTYDVRPWP